MNFINCISCIKYNVLHLIILFITCKGFQDDAGSFFFYIMVMIMVNFAAACLVFCVGAWSGNLTVAQTVTAIILTLSMVRAKYGAHY